MCPFHRIGSLHVVVVIVIIVDNRENMRYHVNKMLQKFCYLLRNTSWLVVRFMGLGENDLMKMEIQASGRIKQLQCSTNVWIAFHFIQFHSSMKLNVELISRNTKLEHILSSLMKDKLAYI